jgi:hypothetical protein
MDANSSLKTIEAMLDDPSISYWLKSAILVNLKRDPVDALNDAELLYRVMAKRLSETLDKSTGESQSNAYPSRE